MPLVCGLVACLCLAAATAKVFSLFQRREPHQTWQACVGMSLLCVILLQPFLFCMHMTNTVSHPARMNFCGYSGDMCASTSLYGMLTQRLWFLLATLLWRLLRFPCERRSTAVVMPELCLHASPVWPACRLPLRASLCVSSLHTLYSKANFGNNCTEFPPTLIMLHEIAM